jgi:hypothetical protein
VPARRHPGRPAVLVQAAARRRAPCRWRFRSRRQRRPGCLPSSPLRCTAAGGGGAGARPGRRGLNRLLLCRGAGIVGRPGPKAPGTPPRVMTHWGAARVPTDRAAALRACRCKTSFKPRSCIKPVRRLHALARGARGAWGARGLGSAWTLALGAAGGVHGVGPGRAAMGPARVPPYATLHAVAPKLQWLAARAQWGGGGERRAVSPPVGGSVAARGRSARARLGFGPWPSSLLLSKSPNTPSITDRPHHQSLLWCCRLCSSWRPRPGRALAARPRGGPSKGF